MDRCWIDPYLKPDSSNGYSVISFQGRKYKGHREAYKLLVGSIPEGLELDHLCRNRACYNPKHLEPVTRKENVRRGLMGQKGYNYKAKQNKCIHGHSFDDKNTYFSKDGRRHCRACHVDRERKRRS